MRNLSPGHTLRHALLWRALTRKIEVMNNSSRADSAVESKTRELVVQGATWYRPDRRRVSGVPWLVSWPR